jgi:hypothetical protein
MADIITTQITELSDAKLRAIAKRVLNTMLIASEKAVASQAEPAAYKIGADLKSAEQIFLSRFKSLEATQKQAATTRVMGLVKAPVAKRAQYFDDLAKVDLQAATTVVAQVNALPFPAKLKLQANHLQALQLHGGLLPIGLVPQQTTDKLEFRVHKVRCVDETNPEWLGDDEIALGGTTVDETGDTHKVSEFMVRNDFDDNEQQVYAPPRRFTMFSLLEGGSAWPKCYFVTLVLAEKDMGGLADFLNRLLDAVKAQVIAALGAAIGAVIGSTTGPIGAAIGAIIGWIVGKVFEWLKAWWSDDVFPPKTLTISIPSLAARWAGGKTDSPEGVVRFAAHGGIYDLTYDWRIYA